MEPLAWITLGIVFLTFVGYAVVATVYVSRVELGANRAIDAAKDQWFRSTEDAKQLFSAVIEREISKQDKARHDLGGHLQAQMSSIDLDIRRINDRINDMVHKSDLAAAEQRIMAAINKLDDRFERLAGVTP